MKRAGLAFVLAALTAALPGGALRADCRLALALGLDVSGSVDTGEHALQRRGLANALRHPDIMALLTAGGAPPVEILVYEWSGPGAGHPLQPWTRIGDPAQIDRIASRITSAPRRASDPSTALGSAMAYGIAALGDRGCWQRTLDISGDGKSNTGPRPAPLRQRALETGVTINALVIGADAPASGDARHVDIAELVAYFRANVIAGADAFVETALGFADYEAAMVRKLKRELQGLILSHR